MKTQHFDVESYLNQKSVEINKLHNSIKLGIFDIGRHLFDAKEKMPHGVWGEWIQENCPFSHTAANNFMKYYLTSLGHPEFMHLKKSVIYLLASKRFAKELREEVSQTMLGCHDDLNLKNALALRAAYLNGTIELNSEVIKSYLTKCKQASQVDRLKVEGERMDNLLQEQIKKLDKLIAVKIDIDGDINEQTRYRKKLQQILKDASGLIFQLNDEFKPINIELRKYFKNRPNCPTLEEFSQNGNSGLAECHRLFYEGAAAQSIGKVKSKRRRVFKCKLLPSKKLSVKMPDILENGGDCYA